MDTLLEGVSVTEKRRLAMDLRAAAAKVDPGRSIAVQPVQWLNGAASFTTLLSRRAQSVVSKFLRVALSWIKARLK